MNDTATSGSRRGKAVAGLGSAADAVVLGGSIDGLTAATALARRGSNVLLIEASSALGGSLREIEFAPGYRVAPLAPASEAAVLALGDGEPLLLKLAADKAAITETTTAIERSSASDAARWAAFIQGIQASAGFLAELYRAPPPRIDADTAGEWLALAGVARKFRTLGKRGMAELLRVLPISIADLLDDEFESASLKGALAALAVMDLAQGPSAAGTAFTFLHRQVAAQRATKYGSADFVGMHEARARAAGVTIRMQTAVAGLDVHDGRTTGVVLASGETVSCHTVISSLDPYLSLIELVDPKHHDPEFIHAVRNIRFRGVATRILVALEELPAIPGMPDPSARFGGSILIAPGIRQVERAYEATKYGRCSEEPFIEVHFPGGGRAAIVHVQYTPYRLREGDWASLREGIADRALAAVERRIPGFAARVRARAVLAPPDLERLFGLREGAVSQGEMALDQILFMRPVPDASRYATPIAGYYLCGAGTHPGVGMHGISGELAAAASLKAVRSSAQRRHAEFHEAQKSTSMKKDAALSRGVLERKK